MMRSRRNDIDLGLLWRRALLAGIGLFVVAAAIMQVVAYRRTTEGVVGSDDQRLRPEASERAQAHWRSLLQLERELFVAGYRDDALLVLSAAEGLAFSDALVGEIDGGEVPDGSTPDAPARTQQTFSGIEAIAEAWEGVLRPPIAAAVANEGVVAEVRILSSEARRVEALLQMIVTAEGSEDTVVLLEMRAVARMDKHGSIFEERLEVLQRSEFQGAGTPR